MPDLTGRVRLDKGTDHASPITASTMPDLTGRVRLPEHRVEHVQLDASTMPDLTGRVRRARLTQPLVSVTLQRCPT